jgi:hypothetical protein
MDEFNTVHIWAAISYKRGMMDSNGPVNRMLAKKTGRQNGRNRSSSEPLVPTVDCMVIE